MNKIFQDVYEQRDGILRFALMEKEGNGAGLKRGKIDVARIRRLPNVVVAIGHNIATNSFDRWVQELNRITKANVYWVHTKYMLVDPLSDTPGCSWLREFQRSKHHDQPREHARDPQRPPRRRYLSG